MVTRRLKNGLYRKKRVKRGKRARQKVGENGSRVWYNKMRFAFFAGLKAKKPASGAERDDFLAEKRRNRKWPNSLLTEKTKKTE